MRVFADGMCLLQPPDYPKRDKQEPVLYWVDVQAETLLVTQVLSFVVR